MKEPAATTGSGEAKPVRCIRRHADKEVRKAFPEICEGLIEKAKTGAIGQTKLLIKIGGLDEKPEAGKKRKRGKTLSSMLMEELKRGKEQGKSAG